MLGIITFSTYMDTSILQVISKMCSNEELVSEYVGLFMGIVG